MVMIPLLLTFLSVLQVSTGVMSRTVATNVVQGSAAAASMTSSEVPAVDPSTSVRDVPLPGGGSITITERQIHQTSITPLLPGGDNFEATGIAITE